MKSRNNNKGATVGAQSSGEEWQHSTFGTKQEEPPQVVDNKVSQRKPMKAEMRALARSKANIASQ